MRSFELDLKNFQAKSDPGVRYRRWILPNVKWHSHSEGSQLYSLYAIKALSV